ncbi:hypothetical protein [uncultured Rummeliibacillus sp.]|uniref:hypothetical protein n=1 Tax=uncultured Rummeliibacillus sp. TaxID=762292 RepID=UPI002622CEE5|nr:hypothetical protein [uncultured Rummeliibacillus sp.]
MRIKQLIAVFIGAAAIGTVTMYSNSRPVMAYADATAASNNKNDNNNDNDDNTNGQGDREPGVIGGNGQGGAIGGDAGAGGAETSGTTAGATATNGVGAGTTATSPQNQIGYGNASGQSTQTDESLGKDTRQSDLKNNDQGINNTQNNQIKNKKPIPRKETSITEPPKNNNNNIGFTKNQNNIQKKTNLAHYNTKVISAKNTNKHKKSKYIKSAIIKVKKKVKLFGVVPLGTVKKTFVFLNRKAAKKYAYIITHPRVPGYKQMVKAFTISYLAGKNPYLGLAYSLFSFGDDIERYSTGQRIKKLLKHNKGIKIEEITPRKEKERIFSGWNTKRSSALKTARAHGFKIYKKSLKS